MSEFKGTPGPWKTTSWSFRNDHLYSVITEAEGEGNGVFLGTVASHVPGAEENARLIAAAPEMLDALQGVVIRTFDGEPCWCYQLSVHTRGLEHWANHSDACKAAKAAIAKALGEQP